MAQNQLLLRREPRMPKSISLRHRPHGPSPVPVKPNATTKAVLRDMAFVLHATQSIKEAILAKATPVAAP
jgi:hypothetical protein